MPIAKRVVGKTTTAKKPVARTQPRVTKTEDASRAAKKTAAHREVESPVKAMIQDLGNGEALIVAQGSELVPVAQFANVTLGPNMIAWKLNLDLSPLADVNWDDEDVELTEQQQAAHDRGLNALKGTSRIIHVHLADDREMVLDSVQEQNRREESEAGANKKKQTRARRS